MTYNGEAHKARAVEVLERMGFRRTHSDLNEWTLGDDLTTTEVSVEFEEWLPAGTWMGNDKDRGMWRISSYAAVYSEAGGCLTEETNVGASKEEPT